VFCYPPIVVRLEGTDGNDSSATCYSKLVFTRTPSYKSGRAIQSKQDQRGFPHLLSTQGVLAEGPDVGISILTAGDDPIAVRCPVDGGDELVVLGEGVEQDPACSSGRVDFDLIRIGADCDLRPVCIEGVGGEGSERELMDLSCHCGKKSISEDDISLLWRMKNGGKVESR
jgi:hypothetical protein